MLSIFNKYISIPIPTKFSLTFYLISTFVLKIFFLIIKNKLIKLLIPTLVNSVLVFNSFCEVEPSLRKDLIVPFSIHPSRIVRAVLPVSFLECTKISTLIKSRQV